MRRCILLILAAAILVLAPGAALADWSDLGIYSTTRYESHTIPGGDNTMSQNFNFSLKTGRRSTVFTTLGYQYDLEDSESNGLLMGMTYLHSFSGSNYAVLGYSNSHMYESSDDQSLGDTFDAWYFSHVWKLVKRHHINIDLRTTYVTDTGFDNNRTWNEAIEFSGPVARKITWRLAYQYGHSFVADTHASNVWDLGFSFKAFRYGRFNLGYRTAKFLGGVDVNDNVWILSYNQRLR